MECDEMQRIVVKVPQSGQVRRVVFHNNRSTNLARLLDRKDFISEILFIYLANLERKAQLVGLGILLPAASV